MNQTCLDLDTLPAGHPDRTGFELGWDHAHHGLVPPPHLLLQGTSIRQGWLAGKAVFGSRTLGSSRAVRLWLQLRTDAWRHRVGFEGLQVTPNYLAQIETTVCPVTRRALGGGAASPDAPVVERLQPGAAYAAGHLAVISRAAAQARQGRDHAWLMARSHLIESVSPADPTGLDAPALRRLALLGSFVTPLPFAHSVRLPLLVLPPNRVRVLNAPQGLQAMITWQLAAPGWSAKLRALADGVPDAAQRQDFQLLVGALAPRVVAIAPGLSPIARRQALEDLWTDERVLRRWQHVALQLGEAGVGALLERAAAMGAVRTIMHAADAATDGWSSPRPAWQRRAPRPWPQPLARGSVVAGQGAMLS